MDKGENPAQSISFLWYPLAYPVRWADTPDDVPKWDVSRQPRAWGRNLGSSERNSPINAAPSTGYPRLVCADEYIRGHRPWPERGHKYLINRLLTFYEHVHPWQLGKPVKKLRGNVMKFSYSYGAPYKREDNTLKAWLCLAAVVHGYMLSYELLQKFEYEGMQAKIDDMLGSFQATYTTPLNAPRHPEPYEFMSDKFSPIEMEFLVLSQLRHLGKIYEEREEEVVDWYFELGGEDSFRLGVAEHLHSIFNRAFSLAESSQARLTATTQAIYAECNVATWIYYRLAQVWRHGAEVRACPVCGTLFAPTRKNMKYCRRGTCAFKAHKQNQKARAARS